LTYTRAPAARRRADRARARARRRGQRRRWVDLALTVLTWVLLFVILAPILYLIVASTQPARTLASGRFSLCEASLGAYSQIWRTVEFGKYLTNSLVVCTSAAAMATVLAAGAGYALARLQFRGSKVLSFSVIGTQLVPGSMFLLPLFLGFIWLDRSLGIKLIDSQAGLALVYTAFFMPVSIYLMRSFFLAVPPELEEAALVDGCTPRGAFWRVVLPNATPGLLATFVYAFLFAWDELLFAANLTRSNSETIPIGIRNFIGNYSEEYDQLMAAGVVSTIPVMIAFFLTQRWLVKGLTAGAVKG
jgi:multiple sugar transport system permease protein